MKLYDDGVRDRIGFTAFMTVVSCLVAVLILGPHLFPDDPILKDPPAGWIIETNGKAFRLRKPNKQADIFEFSTRQDAVDSAWRFYDYSKRRPEDWKPVK